MSLFSLKKIDNVHRMYMKFKRLQIKLIREKDRETKEKNKGVGYLNVQT